MHSIYSTQGEHFDSVDEFLNKNPTQEEKNSAAFKFVKTCKLNADLEPIERLINSGVSPNSQDPEGKSLLMIAAQRGFLELVQSLLELNVDMRLKDRSGRTALFYAIEANNENVDVVSYLLDHGADLNHESQERATPLLRSVERGYYEITKMLLEKGANLHTGFDGSGDTALHLAVKRSDKRIINLLFEYGCDPNKKNKKKLTPRELCQNSNPELYQYLINLSSSQKVNQSNIIKTALETPTMHQEYNRQAGSDERGMPPIFDILPFDKDSNRGAQNQPDFSEPKKSKNQNNNEPSKKQKGRNESPTAGIKRSNYFPQQKQSTDFPENPDLSSHNDTNEPPELTQNFDENHLSTANTSQQDQYYKAYNPEEDFTGGGGRNEGNIPQHQQGRKKNDRNLENPQGEQMQYGNPQGPQQGNFRPGTHPSQLKHQQQGQGQPQGYYGQNPNTNNQFFNNNNPNNPQNPNAPFQKRKSNKGQGPTFNKNFPNNSNNPNFPNPNTPNPMNPNQNPYNRKGSGGGPAELNPVGQPNLQMSPTNNANGKFNKGQQNRPQYNDKNAQRAYNMPNMVNMPPNMQGMTHNMPQPEMMMENFSPQADLKNIKDGGSKIAQSPILYNNNAPNPTAMMAHAFHTPGHGGYPDMRGGPQGGPGQFLLNENVGVQMFNKDPMNQGNYGQQMNFNMPPPQNTQSPQMNPMMNKPQFVSGGTAYQNPSLVDNSNIQNTNVKTFFYDLSDSLQKQNMKLKADFLTINKINKESKKDSEKLKQENTTLKTSLETTRQNEQKLKKLLSEREALIEELTKKSEELESAIKNATSKSDVATYDVASIITEPMLETFQVETMGEILRNPRQNVEFLKPEYVSKVLHEEILAFEKAVNTFNGENNLTFESLIEDMKAHVVEAVPGAEWEIYGSFATGLCLPWSDIDIVIKAPQAAYGTTVLDAMETSFKKKKFVEDAKVIRNTSVPVYKITCTKQYLNKKVDISLHDPRHNGILCVELVKEYLAFYPPLRSIVLILKQFLAKLNLNDTYLGGLSSYGLILMVVFLFQTREMQRATESMDNQNLGALLLSFLYFYGFEYDYYTQFLVNPRKIPKGKDKQNDMLVDNYNLMHILNQNPPSIMEPKIIIQDPLSSTNNVGRSTFNIKEIKNAFMAAYFEAFKPCVCEVHRSIADIESINGKTQHKCASVFKRMMLAYHPQK